MKKLTYLYLLCFVASIASCRSSRNLTATDAPSYKQKQNKDVLFLDNVSITPGDKKTTTLNNSGKKKFYSQPSLHRNNNFDVEDATEEQIRYATMLNIPVEDLADTLLLQNIDYWWGTKFCMGGSTESCIDCSYFTQAIMRDVYNFRVPRTAQEQYDSSERIKNDDLIQGDLVFFHTMRKSISHVGLYLGNHKFVHVSQSNGVMISDLNETYWQQRYRGAGRILR